MNSKNLVAVTELRHELHRNPELSMQETWTKGYLMDFLKLHTTLEIVDKGEWFYAAYNAGEGKPCVAFRADFDAIAMDDKIDRPYASKNPGVAHKCGHDGHSAILVGFAMEVDQYGADKNIIFLFQPGEETGEGAMRCLSVFDERKIDEMYALHNMPGIPYGAVALKNGTMFCASRGLEMRFMGTSTHASQPEKGKNPVFAMAEVTNAIPTIYAPEKYKGLVLCTVVHMEAGEKAFGIAAGEGSLWLTCRGQFEEEMEAAINELSTFALSTSKKYGITCSFSFSDEFPETSNHKESADKVRAVCRKMGVPVQEMEMPYRSSEDFGHFLKHTKGAVFLVGMGDGPAIHTVEYDFSDGIIDRSVELLKALVALPE
ncbi:MAG TPA: amidohydrolase [Clostridia bacterium]|nr:amidohydrolase [Clostridia bacterium]